MPAKQAKTKRSSKTVSLYIASDQLFEQILALAVRKEWSIAKASAKLIEYALSVSKGGKTI